MFGSDARLYSIYMEYLPYSDLAAWRIRTINHFFTGTPDDAKRVLSDMASALVYLEEQGIIHNDIKPSNILFDRTKGAILIDFGLASTTRTRELCTGGSPWYMAPEFRDRTRGVESDVFALGVTLLFLLKKIELPDVTERGWIIASLFADKSQRALMAAWGEKVGKVATQLAVTGIEPIVRRMLLKDHQRRMSARGVVQSLAPERRGALGAV